MRRGLDHRNPWSAPDDFPHIFRDGERGIRHGRIIQGIKGAYRHGNRFTHFRLRSAACGNIMIGGRSNLGDHLIARTRKVVLLKAGIGVDVARGQVHRRVRRLFHRTKIRFCNVGQPYSVPMTLAGCAANKLCNELWLGI